MNSSKKDPLKKEGAKKIRATKTKATQALPLIGIIMGSDSDWPTLEPAAAICARFGVPYETRVVSAHRTPLEMTRYAGSAAKRGIRVIVAAAGGAAHLPGMVASLTPLPVIGVPVESKALKGMDSLLSIVQMPAGVPVATVAIGGGLNAGLLALQIIGAGDEKVRQAMLDYQKELAQQSKLKNQRLKKLAATVPGA
jgi:5-(carboxyamino)imidazole ribonucleotide mutase